MERREKTDWPTMFDHLPAEQRELLELLPCEPNGVSLQELAADLLGRRDPRAVSEVAERLAGLGAFLGGLTKNRGPEMPVAADGIDRPDVHLYGLPRDIYRVVCRILSTRGGPPNGSGQA